MRVVDYNMPGMSGIELVARLEERHLHCPVILITSGAAHDVTERGAIRTSGRCSRSHWRTMRSSSASTPSWLRRGPEHDQTSHCGVLWISRPASHRPMPGLPSGKAMNVHVEPSIGQGQAQDGHPGQGDERRHRRRAQLAAPRLGRTVGKGVPAG
jgi:Response regulator receiver domain